MTDRSENTTFPKQPTRASVLKAINESDPAVARAMVLLHMRQTQDEKQERHTKHSNNRGLNKWAANKASYYAVWVEDGRKLTGRHLANARRIARVHRRQLLEEAWRKWWKDADVLTGDVLVLREGIQVHVSGKNRRVKKASQLMYVGMQDRPGEWFEPLIRAVIPTGEIVDFKPSDLYLRLDQAMRGSSK